MKVLVTGAGGFLGDAVVRSAKAAGHDVLAMVRPASAQSASTVAGVTLVKGDLRQGGDWQAALAAADAVIHCAAAASGDLPTQLAGTVLATENLLSALPAGLKRFVHISSFSVYDFAAPGFLGRFDEQTPLEALPLRRDAYTQTKLQQEKMVRDHCAAKGTPLAVIRPGAIYGPGKNWNYGTAMKLGPLDLVFAPLSPMRLTYVDNCADAIVAALEAPIVASDVFNVVDDEQPGYLTYHRRARAAGAKAGLGVPVPYLAVLGLGLAARIASKLFFGGKAKLPEMFDIPRQRVQWRGLRYGNSHAKQALGWQPRVSLDRGIAATVAGDE
jgi:2-alkyl-3-oxoalkanoate reductase